jgi:hypothetical protein
MHNNISSFFKADGKGFLLIGLLCFVAFSPILSGQFKGMDDDFSIVSNQDLRSASNLPKIFTTGYFKGRDYYRPLTNVSYMAEYHAFGLTPFFYNFDGILLHILNAWLVFLLAGLLLDDRRKAWWVSLIFAVHPLQWEAVGNISGRAILLCTVFVLLAFILFLKYLKDKKPELVYVSALCFALGLLCKESAAILVVVLGLYMLLNRRKEWQAFIPFFIVVVVYLAWRNHLGLTQVFPWRNVHEMFFGFTSFLFGVFTYLRLIIIPAGLYFDRSAPLFPLNAVLAPLFTWAVYIAFAAWLWLTRSRVAPFIVFCIAWFFMELLPVAQLLTSIGVQTGTISLAEHFMYVPLIPAGILVVLAGEKLAARLEAGGMMKPQVLRLVAGGLVAFAVITSMQQAFYASNEAAMIKQSLAANPNNARLQAALAMVYVRAQEYQSAEEHFRKASALDPAEVRYSISVGKSLADQGRYAEALAQYATIKKAWNWQKLLDDNIAAAERQMKK